MPFNPVHHDYYAILDIPKSANTEEVKSAYRKLAKHPDRSNELNATASFQAASPPLPRHRTIY